MDPASLPAGPGQHRADGLLKAGVGIGDDQLHAGQPACLERAQERGPEGAVLADSHVQAQDLAATIGGHAGGNHDRAGDDPAIDAGLEAGGIQEQVREGDVAKRTGPEAGNLGVQLGADPADLRLGDASIDAKGLNQVVDLAGGGAVHIGLYHHRQQGPVDPAARFQQRREERPLARLGIFRSTSPALVDSSRERDPLRWVVRCWERW